MEMVPAPFVTLIAEPAMRDALTGATPVEPIRSCPFVGGEVDVIRPPVPLYKNALVVRPETVNDDVIVTAEGNEIVIAPVGEDTTIWLIVPVRDDTPVVDVASIVIVLAVDVRLTFVPATRVLRVNAGFEPPPMRDTPGPTDTSVMVVTVLMIVPSIVIPVPALYVVPDELFHVVPFEKYPLCVKLSYTNEPFD